MTHFAAQQSSVQSKLGEKGAAVSFSRQASTSNFASGQPSGSPTTASSSGVSVRTSPSKLAALATSGIVITNPISIFVAALNLGSFVPRFDDSMTFGAFTYSVKDVETLAPDGTAIAYTIVGSR